MEIYFISACRAIEEPLRSKVCRLEEGIRCKRCRGHVRLYRSELRCTVQAPTSSNKLVANFVACRCLLSIKSYYLGHPYLTVPHATGAELLILALCLYQRCSCLLFRRINHSLLASEQQYQSCLCLGLSGLSREERCGFSPDKIVFVDTTKEVVSRLLTKPLCPHDTETLTQSA